jgi:hypothetical protein
VAFATLAAAALAPAPAASEGSPACTPSYVPYLGPACRLPSGLYEVVLADGTRLLTHGPDPLPPPGDVGFASGDDERQPVCSSESRMHVLYGYPAGAKDRTAAVTEQLRDAVRRMNALLNREALDSGGVTADYKVQCDAAGEIQVDTFSGPSSSASTSAYTDDFAAIVNAARAAGHLAAETDYLIFYDDDSDGVCGVGNLAADDSLSADNENLNGPDYGVAYKSCWFGRTPMHENGHNQGAVQDLAPDWDLSGHCLEGIDVMCYPTSSILVLCADRTHFDCDNDTYFDAAPEPGEWLATHWNIGSPLNRYIAFNHTPAPTNASQDAPGNGSASPPASQGQSGTATATSTTASSKPPAQGTTGTRTSTVARDVRPTDDAGDGLADAPEDDRRVVAGPGAVLALLAALAAAAWSRRVAP